MSDGPRKEISVDFDGVLHSGEDEPGTPLPGAHEFLDHLRDEGFKITILSARPAPEIERWLKSHGMEDDVDEVTDQKPPALVHVDDRAVRFNGDFKETLEEIEHFEPWWDDTNKNSSHHREMTEATQKEKVMPYDNPGHKKRGRTSRGATSARQYGMMHAARAGRLRGMGPSKEIAEEFIERTPTRKRRSFAKVLAGKRRYED